MKTHISILIIAIGISGIMLNLEAQEAKNPTVGEAPLTPHISDIKNNVVSIQDLDLGNEDRRKIEVRISSEHGKYSEYGKSLYFKHRWTKEDSKVAYDFSQYPDGIYSVELFEKNQLVCSRVVEKKAADQTQLQVAALVKKEK